MKTHNWRRAISKNVRINDRIRAREVRVIDEDGGQLGIMHPFAALDLARQRGLDLVEVAPNAIPPVCRLLDYGRFRYEQTKRERESRKTQKLVTVKEMRFEPKISEHDRQTKSNNIKRFLESGDKVKLTVRFRGRELVHPEIGQNILIQVIEELGDTATVEQPPKLEGRSMTAVLAPRKEAARARRIVADAAEPDAAAPDGGERKEL